MSDEDNEITFEWEDKSEDTIFAHHVIGFFAFLYELILITFYSKAGCLAGISEHCLLLPFDNVKIHLQILKADTPKEVEGIIRNLYRNGGILSFWKGASVMASGCIPAHAAYFSIFEASKKGLIDRSSHEIHPYLNGLTGVFATIAHDMIITPFDVMKQRSQIMRESTMTILNYTIKNEGFFAFYRSLPITMFMNMPWAFILVGTNETLKTLFIKRENRSFFSYFCCAAVAASVASLCTIPLDNIKTRLQTQTCHFRSCNTERCTFSIAKNLNKSRNLVHKPLTKHLHLLANQFSFGKILKKIGLDEQSVANLNQMKKSCHLLKERNKIKYVDVTSTIKTMFHEEGLKGFTKGLLPRIMGQAPSAAVSWATYDTIKNFLVKKRMFMSE